MSPEPLRLPRAPRGARVVAEDAAALRARLSGEREARAFERGREQGRREAVEGAAGALEQAAERLDRAREEAADELARAAVELSLAIARELLVRELAAGGCDVEALVRETLRHSRAEHAPCAVHLHPGDAARLSQARFRAGVTIEADEAVGPGCAHVLTPQGLLVRDQRELLDAVAARLREALP